MPDRNTILFEPEKIDTLFGLPVSPYLRSDGELVFVFYDDLKFTDTLIGDVVIPNGFHSDGCSIPRMFWTIIGHPLAIDYMREAFLHDWLYYTQPCARKIADKILYDEMKKSGRVGWFRRSLIYRGIRIGGWAAWNKHAKRIKAEQEAKAEAPTVESEPTD